MTLVNQSPAVTSCITLTRVHTRKATLDNPWPETIRCVNSAPDPAEDAQDGAVSSMGFSDPCQHAQVMVRNHQHLLFLGICGGGELNHSRLNDVLMQFDSHLRLPQIFLRLTQIELSLYKWTTHPSTLPNIVPYAKANGIRPRIYRGLCLGAYRLALNGLQASTLQRLLPLRLWSRLPRIYRQRLFLCPGIKLFERRTWGEEPTVGLVAAPLLWQCVLETT